MHLGVFSYVLGPDPPPPTKGIKTFGRKLQEVLECPDPPPPTKGIKTGHTRARAWPCGPDPPPPTKGIKTLD